MLDLTLGWNGEDPLYVYKQQLIDKHQLPHQFGSVDLVHTQNEDELSRLHTAMFEVRLAIMAGEVYLQACTSEVEANEPKVAELREGVRLCKLMQQWLEPFVPIGAESHPPEEMVFMLFEAVRRHEN